MISQFIVLMRQQHMSQFINFRYDGPFTDVSEAEQYGNRECAKYRKGSYVIMPLTPPNPNSIP